MEEILKYRQQLEELIDAGREIEILTLISRFHHDDIAHLIDALEEEKKAKLFRILNIETASEVLVEIDDISRELILDDIPRERLTQIVDDMPSDDAADIIGDLPIDQAQEILSHIDEEKSRDVQKLLRYPEDTAGGIMQTELISIGQLCTVKDAIEKIRSRSDDVEDIHNVFVTDDDIHLVGILPLRKLILAKDNTPIQIIMDSAEFYVTAEVDQEEVAKIFKKYDIVSLPVVSQDMTLLGRVVIDDIIDVIEEETSEDILMMAGVTKEEDIVYSGHILTISRKRLPWLVINLFGTILTGYFLWLFEATLKELLALVTFVPVVTAMSGNVGIQSSSIVIRGLATGRIDLLDLRRTVIKESCIGILIGLCCGLIGGIVAFLWHHGLVLGFVIGISLVITITFAATLGILVPVFFKKVHIDPAVASGPLVTTTNDIMAILIYFGLASMFLKLMLK
jgi:magnesium transporter